MLRQVFFMSIGIAAALAALGCSNSNMKTLGDGPVVGQEPQRQTFVPQPFQAQMEYKDGLLHKATEDVNGQNRVYSFAYDEKNRVEKIIFRDTDSSEMVMMCRYSDASGKLIRFTDPTGLETLFTWDEDGNLVRMTGEGYVSPLLFAILTKSK